MKTKDKRNALIGRILWIAALCSVLTMGTMSGYVSRTHSVNLARVGKFVYETSLKKGTASVDLSELNNIGTPGMQSVSKPGDTAEFELEVRNHDSFDSVSEVTQNYTITIAAKGSMPLRFSLVRTDDGSNTEKIAGTVPGGSLASSDTYSSSLKAGEKCTHKYKLTIQWPEDINDIKYANGTALGKITLEFSSQQVD